MLLWELFLAKTERLPADQVEAVLAMVDAAAAVVAEAEHADAFDEYAELVRSLGRIPGYDPGPDAEASASILDVNLFLGVGLALLGPMSLQVLDAVKGLVKQRGRSFQPDVDTEEVVERVVTGIPATAEVSGEMIELIVRLQVNAFGKWVITHAEPGNGRPRG